MTITTTNIMELENHLKKVFGEFLKTKTFEKKADAIGEIFRQNTLHMLGSGRYDYLQSGNLRHLIQTTSTGWEGTKTKTKIGFGALEDMSDSRNAKRPRQSATFFSGTDYEKHVVFGSEPSLPEWILAEFGRKAGSGVSASGIPKEFIVNYTARDSGKEFMAGPSSTRHYRKNVFFMATREKIKGMFPSEPVDDLRKHPGMAAGHVFSGALEHSIPAIHKQFEEAIMDSLNELANTHGNKGGVI